MPKQNRRRMWFPDHCPRGGRAPGMALLITLVLLVAMASLAYSLGGRVEARRIRYQYIIDYQAARYACDSAVKYAMATVEEVETTLVQRPNEPDFSDLFAIDDEQYRQMLEEIALQRAEQEAIVEDVNMPASLLEDIFSVDGSEPNDPNEEFYDPNDLSAISVRGPYGYAWPLVADPVQFDIGQSSVTIEIHDENAKYPLCWALMRDATAKRAADAGFKTFFEWMGYDAAQIDMVAAQLDRIGQIKQYRDLAVTGDAAAGEKKTTAAARRGLRRRTQQSAAMTGSNGDFARLFHSPMLDTESLAQPTITSDSREESALKYLAAWGSDKVNVNSAPRHVLESAFAFGGDAPQIADAIIRRRRIEPFETVDQVKQSLLQYSGSITKCEKYIITNSDFFTVRVSALSGTARASTVMAIRKTGQKTERLAVIMD